MTLSEELIWTVWIFEGSWRVLSQWATWHEAGHTLARLRQDGEPVILSKTGSALDDLIRAGKYPIPERV